MKKLLGIFVITALLCLSMTANAATLIGHWGFEEGSGTTANDSSSNTLNGTINNAAYTTGKVGSYALAFNGSNSFVEVAYSALLNPDTVSISLWFNPGSSQVMWADLLDKGHGAGTTPYYGGYVLQYHEPVDGPPYTQGTINTGYGNGSTFPSMNTGSSYLDNTWHHLVAALGADGMALYVDNQLITSGAGQGAIVDNDSSLYFGRHRTLGRYFSGLIDDVQIYEGVLTADDVDRLYSQGTTVPVPGAIFLFAPGLACLAALRRRFLK
ncbi:Concanavalin A-like lectin/glucanases superfamily protein [Syntrophus gentianae]|uniref:Concanavalin A-like lectin/glucanases superfamily protein n=1 Tax=Syntrophus gentianae TaxID=43775 RepID=A0A1H7WR68_9BACT|nr:LamG domain-containing protein [Syntrophus gentianae]SEM24016.1 Concanavalin A-like lectin/glucanases superfamily protein [Syntrophus gentianae]